MHAAAACLGVWAVMALAPIARAAQSDAAAQGPPDYALAFDEIAFDFGEITDAAPVRHAFGFVNVETVTVHPAHRTPCGMTAAFDKAAYAPGERGVLLVTYDPRHRRGRVQKSWTGGCAERAGELRVTVFATVVPVVDVSNPVVNLGEIRQGEGARRRVVVTGLGTDFDVAGAEGLGDHVELAIEPARAFSRGLRPFRSVDIEIAVAADAPLGALHRDIVLRCTGAEARDVRIAVRGTVVGELRASVSVVHIRAAPGEDFSGAALLASRDGLPFLITSVSVEAETGPPVEVDWTPAMVGGAVGYEVTLRGTAPSVPTLLRGTVVIDTDRAGEQPVRIGYRVPAPRPSRSRRRTPSGSRRDPGCRWRRPR